MNKNIRLQVLLLFASICLAGPLNAQDNITGTGGNWLSESQINIVETGMIKTVLLPGLHCLGTEASSATVYPLDLSLIGPDGKPRAFELFWTGKGNTQKVSLAASSIKLDDQRRLLWEGSIPDNFNAKRIIVGIPDKNYVGKVDIHGLASSGWRMLAEDIALYKTTGEDDAVIEIPEGEYKRLRLYFSGYDAKFQEIPAFVEQVEIEGEVLKTGYAEDIIRPEFEQAHDEKSVEIRATLPGSGIWIDNLTITTGAVFQGAWQLGCETIVVGEQVFQEIRSGERSLVNNDNTSLVIGLGIKSEGERLIVKLDSQDYFGEILDVSIKARLPHMIFFADQKGLYTARTGLGKKAYINERTAGLETGVYQAMEFSEIKTNPMWHPDDLAQDYMTKGGPFKGDGYTWEAPLHIDNPGFYRLVLNDRAGLEDNRQGLRLVKDDVQVPYFFGRKEKRKISIKQDLEYDKENNRSVMPLTLPYESGHWTAVQLTGKGIFKRKIIIETRQPGKAGQQTWLARDWISAQNEMSSFTLGINELPRDRTEMRLIIDHGDNQPIELEDIQAVYQSQDLFFLASDAGTYQVFGGNPDAQAASYDISIVRNYLLKTEPAKINMGEMEPLQRGKWGAGLRWVFSEQGWGLYAVLGLVTVILLIIIVRLFPRG
ncbi:MAG: hypothetical protein JW944_05995 [Deltaproteobacteria bacterium]|nr:hypothetical protein [Deltaproteobacteria bacterium]